MNQAELSKKGEMTEYTVSEAHVTVMIMCRFNETMEITEKLAHGVQHVITYSLKKALQRLQR
jgi:hypothetical protein